MFIGKWNKSVILTYVGMALSVAAMFLSFTGAKINYALVCLMFAGICDLFDGAVARKCKRTQQEKDFGVQLDSLCDVISFIACPIAVFFGLGLTHIWSLAVVIFYAVCGVARLAYFNITTADGDAPVKYYSGLPVTFSALIFPLLCLFKFVLGQTVFEILFTVLIFIVGLMFILNIKIKKPRGAAYIIFSVLAVAVSVLYLTVL